MATKKPTSGNRSENRGHRPKGLPKTGGRKKGTPNKTTAEHRGLFSNLTSDYFNSEQFRKDLASLSPKDRVDFMLKAEGFVISKAVDTNITITDETTQSLEETLIALSGITSDE